MVQRTDLAETPDYFGEDDLHKDALDIFSPNSTILWFKCLWKSLCPRKLYTLWYMLVHAILILPRQFLFHPGIAWTQNLKNEVNTLLWTMSYSTEMPFYAQTMSKSHLTAGIYFWYCSSQDHVQHSNGSCNFSWQSQSRPQNKETSLYILIKYLSFSAVSQ